MSTTINRWRTYSVAVVAALFCVASPANAQRVLGIDISAHQGLILKDPTANPADSNWETLFTTDNRKFAFIRSSRGGTTGYDHRQGAYPAGNNSAFTLSQRYDDPYFVMNMNLATTTGLYVGPYHRSRADVIASTPNSGGIANTGTDDATHFLQQAGAFMRPGYLVPVLDYEDGIAERNDIDLTQFALDFSNRIYEVMQIRPAIYINGNYAQNGLAGGTLAQRNELAQPGTYSPSVVSPAFPTLWSARWPNQANPHLIDPQNEDPQQTFANIFGPWDDYGAASPWQFWQYASTARLVGYKNQGMNIDVDVSHGDFEYLKDSLVPAVWWHDSSGNWSDMANWNSGQPVVGPPGPPTVPSCGTCTSGTGQVAPIGTQTLPEPRLPGTAGTGPAVTSGVNDTVILERPNANITVTLSNGNYNIRKLYMRESLTISGGSLTINYDPNYNNDFDNNPATNFPNAMRSGPISAQFSGAVILVGGALSAHTVQVDAAQTFTLASGTLTFNTINLMSGVTPAKIAVTGNVFINPLNNATATISASSGATVDLSGSVRQLSVGNGASSVDLSVDVPITNGSLTKTGAGTMRLGAANTYTGLTSIMNGILLATANDQLGATGIVTSAPGTLQLSGNVSYALPMTIGGGGVSGVSTLPPGTPGALDNLSGDNTWSGPITLAGIGANGGDPLLNQIGAQAGTLRVSGVIQNATGITATWAKTGNGDVILSGASPNTYTGLSRLSGGRLIIEKDGALGSAGSLTAAAGNTFQLPNSASTLAFRAPESSPGLNYTTFEVINTSGTGAPGFGQVDSLGGDNTFAGQIAFDGPTLSGARQGSIGVTSGSLHVTGGMYARGSDGAPRHITKLGAGTLKLSGDGAVVTGNTLVVPFANSTFSVNAGAVELNGPTATTTNLPGVTTWNVASGATLNAASGRFLTNIVNVNSGGQFNLTGGSLGVATVNGSLSNQGGTVLPGNSPGLMTITGNYTQQSAGSLAIEIGGTSQGINYDYLSVAGAVTLDGQLQLDLISDFNPSVSETFTILTSSSLVGALSNVANGERLTTIDGLGSFLVNYGAGSAFNPNHIVLSAFVPVPYGDYNNDDVVDAADYVVWRHAQSDDDLPHDLSPGSVGEADYETWGANFGTDAGGGGSSNVAVPEPSTIALSLVAGGLALQTVRLRSGQRVRSWPT